MPFLLRRIGFAVCVLSSLATCLQAEDAAVDSSRFEITQLAAGLIQPMELAVAPDGTVYFIEVNGKLKAINLGNHEVVLIGEINITTIRKMDSSAWPWTQASATRTGSICSILRLTFRASISVASRSRMASLIRLRRRF
ncbi:MAG: hypothetical protein WKF77_14945 [Planctomycetaceae bacterium]